MRLVPWLAALLLASCGGSTPATVDGAIQALSQNRVAEAESVLRGIAADPAATRDDRAKARRELGRILWLVDGDAARALAEIEAARREGVDACASGRLEARILRESGQAERLLERLDPLLRPCAGPDSAGLADSIRLYGAEAALDLARKGGKARIDQAAGLLASVGEDRRESLGGSAVGLEAALLRGDADAALKAWKDYFWLTGDDVPQGLAAHYPAAAPVFDAGLAAGADVGARLRLVDLLVRAGFAQAAERFADAAGLPGSAAGEPLWRKAAAYFEARRSLERAVTASNRRVARGGPAADLKALAAAATGRLAEAAGERGDSKQALLRAYSIYGRVDDTGGYMSVHLGHVVQMDRRMVEQYGHRAEVGFIALDNMLANGFETWLWDGAAATGGWTEDGPVIVQIRPEYTSSPLSAWEDFSGKDPRPAQRREADEAALGGVDVAYLPELGQRLRLQVARQVGERAKAALPQGGDLRRAFLAEYWRASFQQSIFIHEGRHALDRKLVRGLARFYDSNLEYRAKLSELALADYPRLALLNINAETIGGGTAHGKANTRVLKAYVAWMRANASAIPGYDAKRPPLPQIDRLSDAQLRAVARGLDPIAN